MFGHAPEIGRQAYISIGIIIAYIVAKVSGVSKIYKCTTVLPAKSDSCVMFCLQTNQGLIFNRSLVY